jgi:hypothetical protein
VAALLGVDRLLRINFNLPADPATFVAQALNGVQERLAEWGACSLPLVVPPASS